MNKKVWDNPKIMNLCASQTKEGECPAASGVESIHDFGIFGKCEHLCSVCGGCKNLVIGQLACGWNDLVPKKHCLNYLKGGCKTSTTPDVQPDIPGIS